MPSRHFRRPCLLAAVVVGVCGVAPCSSSQGATLEVKTSQGLLVGEQAGEGVRIYRGIPYAAPPVGALRWKDPQPPVSWRGVLDATHFGARCMQISGNAQQRNRVDVTGLPLSEDCLFLNVWTAAEKPRDRRPVIVWIHGGTFMIGTGAQFDGSTLAKRGVVVVTINYRLGAFGLFAHRALTAESAHHTSGNYAFADTLAALAWVRKNIAAFGGDPRRVTVMGQSAGGRLIQSLRTSPCARGLLSRAIIESAPIRILALRTLADAERDGIATAEKAAASTVGELRALPAQQVLDNFPVGQPVIDGRCITQDPLLAPRDGRSHDVDLLVGSNADEGTFPFLRAREFSIAFENAAAYSKYVEQRYAKGAPAFLAAYPSGGDMDFNAVHREAFRDEMAWLAWNSARAHARLNSGKTFLYYFTHRPPAPEAGPDRGATHGAEIAFAAGTPAPNWRDEDRRVSDVMSAYWANFASRGDPNAPGLPEWPVFTGDNGLRMNLGPMTPGPPLDAARIAVFQELFRRVIVPAGDAQRSGEQPVASSP